MPAAPPPAQNLYRFAATAPVLAGPDALEDDAVAAYRRDGFVAIANLLTPGEAADAKAALADLIHGRVPRYEGIQPEPEQRDRWEQMNTDERAGAVRKVWRFVEHSACLDALTRHPRLHHVLETLLGEPCRLIQDMALLKPPFVGTEKPWHQDMAYFGWGPPEKIVGVWIALDPATPENGCMHVLPGTHREGPVAHAHVRDCQIPDDRVQTERDVMVPLAPGGALFFASLLHHGTPPNDSPHRRWAIQYHYAAQSAQRMDRVEHARLYFDGDLYAGCRGQTGAAITELQP